MYKKSIGLIQFVSDLFSLRIGTFILSASNIQSLGSFQSKVDNFTYTCSYDSVENVSNLKINIYIQNGTIYKIDKVIGYSNYGDSLHI